MNLQNVGCKLFCLIDMVRQGLMTSKTKSITKDAGYMVQTGGSEPTAH